MKKQSRKKGIRSNVASQIVKPFDQKEKIILRDYLAMQRTSLANERTLFSYIRTSLYLVLGSIGLLELEEFSNLKWMGYAALGVSALLFIYGIVRYLVLRSKLQNFYDITGLDEDDLERINKRDKESSENPEDNI